MIRGIKFLAFLAFLLLTFSNSYATHLRAGYIHVEQPDPGSLSLYITIIVYLDSESSVPFGGGALDFGDGSEPVIIPEQTAVTMPELGTNVKKSSYTILYTYAANGSFTISYTEPNRNADVMNIPNSVNTKFHLETYILIDPAAGRVNTSYPLLDLFNIFHLDQLNSMAVTMRKAADEIYTYNLKTPMHSRGEIITGYEMPTYAALDYKTGNFTWDLTKEDPHFNFENHLMYAYDRIEFGFGLSANQYKKINETFINTSKTLIDFQILVFEPAEGITVTGQEVDNVIGNNEQVNISRTFASTDTIWIDTVATDLPEGSFDITINANSFEALVDVQVYNNNILDNGPYFIAFRSRTKSSIKDEIATVYFNEKYEHPKYEHPKDEHPIPVITAVNRKSRPSIAVSPNPARDFIRISFQDHKQLQLSLHTPDGRLIMQKNIRSGEKIMIEEPGLFIYTLMNEQLPVDKGKILLLDQ